MSESNQDVEKSDFVYKMEVTINPTHAYSADYLSKQIKVMESQKKIYVLTDNKITYGLIKSFRDVIMEFAEKNKWKYALDLSIKIFQGQFQFLADVPPSPKEKEVIMHPFINSLVKRFINQSNSIQEGASANNYELNPDDQNFMCNAIGVCMYTLIEVGAFQDMFTDLKHTVTEMGMREVFYEELEPYLLLGKVKWVPTKDVRKICEFYNKKDKMAVIKNFLLNLSVDAMDYNLLIATCVENRLHIPLIYICTQSVYEDYLMPAIKLYKEFSDAKLIFNQIDETNFGHYCLWYMRMVLDGKCLGQKIKTSIAHEVVNILNTGFANGCVLLHGANLSPTTQL